MLTRMSMAAAAVAVLSLYPSETFAGPLASAKRGLVFTPNATYPNDNSVWTQSPSDLTWYYNYQASPSSNYASVSQTQFEFVPMLWGAPATPSDTTFLSTVKSLVSKNVNVSYVLTFNEPDGPTANGGSNIPPQIAAQIWVNNIIPLQQMGIRAALPACTGGNSGLPWLKQFLGNCSNIISTPGNTTNCTYDVVPLHWYGDFEGLASHMGQYRATFPNTSMWITEYNLPDQDLNTTQGFYNTSAEYFDRIDYVDRYSLFGAFRSAASNVGPNAAMLNNAGQLTDIGAWYLGRQETGVSPTSSGLRDAIPQVSLSAVVAIAASIVLFSV